MGSENQPLTRMDALEQRVAAIEGSLTPRRTLQRFKIGEQYVCEFEPDMWSVFESDDPRSISAGGPYASGTLQQAVTAAFEAELSMRPATKGGRL